MDWTCVRFVSTRFRHLLVIQILVALAGASAGIFGIVYLAKEGVAPGQGFSLAEAPLFYLFGFFFAAIFCVVMSWKPSINAKLAMSLGIIFYGLTFLSLALFRGIILLILVPIFYGISIPLFYLPFNTLVIKKTTPENRGFRMGAVFLSFTITAVLGPIMAGALIDWMGYVALFTFALILLGMDVFVILITISKVQELSFQVDFSRFGMRNNMALFFEGCYEGLFYALIPLITLTFILKETELGLIFSIFALAGGVMTVILGFASDRIRRRHVFLWAGALASSVFAAIVAYAPNLGIFIGGNSLLQLTSSIAPLFIFAMVADIGEKDPAGVAVTREVLLNSGRAFSLALYFFAALAGVGIQVFFVTASIFLIMILTGKEPD